MSDSNVALSAEVFWEKPGKHEESNIRLENTKAIVLMKLVLVRFSTLKYTLKSTIENVTGENIQVRLPPAHFFSVRSKNASMAGLVISRLNS